MMKITVGTNVSAPIGLVWKTCTTPNDIKKWNAASDDWHTAASVDLREAGLFSSRLEAKDGSMGFDFAGTYTSFRSQEAESRSWASQGRATAMLWIATTSLHR